MIRPPPSSPLFPYPPLSRFKVGVETRLTPARRFSYIVGEGESCHTAQTRFLDLLQDTENNPTLARIEEDRKSTRLNSSQATSRMPSSACKKKKSSCHLS